jgi:hypothetical protein
MVRQKAALPVGSVADAAGIWDPVGADLPIGFEAVQGGIEEALVG